MVGMYVKRRDMIGAVILVACFAMAPRAAHAKGLSSDQVKTLEEGKVVMVKLDDDSGKGYIGGTSWALLEEDLQKAWKAIQDEKVYAKIYPTTIESKVVTKKENKYTVKMVQGNTLVKATYYLNYKTDPENTTLTWKLNKAKPHDIEDSRGTIQFSEYKDGRTLMKMSCIVDLGNAVIEKLFGDEIAMGLLRMPMKFRKFLKKADASKYES